MNVAEFAVVVEFSAHLKEKSMIEYTNSEISAIIDEHIHNQKHRDLLKSRFIDGLTYEQLAEKYVLSVRQIKTLIYKKQEIIFRHLNK